MRSGDDSSRGLYKKFKVERTDGKDGPGKRAGMKILGMEGQ
jgi:hypothetical protein